MNIIYLQLFVLSLDGRVVERAVAYYWLSARLPCGYITLSPSGES